MLPVDAPVANRAAERIIEHSRQAISGVSDLPTCCRCCDGFTASDIGQVLSKIEKRYPIQWHEGDWHGNDTVWRMVLDLNQILLYSDKQGKLHDTPRSAHFSCIDGTLPRKGGAPAPQPTADRPARWAFHPVAVDLACIRMMGDDYHKIPLMMGVERMVRPLVFESDFDRLWESLQVSSNLQPIRHLTNTREMFIVSSPVRDGRGILS